MQKTEPKHQHKFTKTRTRKVRLYGRDGLPTSVYDLFSYKVCACGFEEVFKMERYS